MKFRRELQPLFNAKNVISINLMRLRLRLQKVAPGYVSPPRFTMQERMRRTAIRARTGGFCRG